MATGTWSAGASGKGALCGSPSSGWLEKPHPFIKRGYAGFAPLRRSFSQGTPFPLSYPMLPFRHLLRTEARNLQGSILTNLLFCHHHPLPLEGGSHATVPGAMVGTRGSVQGRECSLELGRLSGKVSRRMCFGGRTGRVGGHFLLRPYTQSPLCWTEQERAGGLSSRPLSEASPTARRPVVRTHAGFSPPCTRRKHPAALLNL